MTSKTKSAVAGAASVILVLVARAVTDGFLGYASACILFPGAIPNLLFFGVHRDWGFVGEITMLTVSATVWFAVLFYALTAVDRIRGRK